MQKKVRYSYLIENEWKDTGTTDVIAIFSSFRKARKYAASYCLDVSGEEYLYIIKMRINDPTNSGEVVWVAS